MDKTEKGQLKTKRWRQIDLSDLLHRCRNMSWKKVSWLKLLLDQWVELLPDCLVFERNTPKLIFLLTSKGETTEKARFSHLHQFMYLVCTCIKTIVSNEEIKTCETNLCHTCSSNEIALHLTEGTQLSRIRGAKGRWRHLAQTPMFA